MCVHMYVTKLTNTSGKNFSNAYVTVLIVAHSKLTDSSTNSALANKIGYLLLTHTAIHEQIIQAYTK